MPVLALAMLLAPVPVPVLPPGVVARFAGPPRLPGGPFVFSPDAAALASAYGGRAERFDLRTGATDRFDAAGAGSGPTDFVWPAGGDLCWVVAEPTGFACLRRRPDGSVVAPTAAAPAGGDRLLTARLSPDGRTVLAVWGPAPRQARRVEVWPFEPGKRSHELAPLRSLAAGVLTDLPPDDRPSGFSADSRVVLFNCGYKLVGYEVATGFKAWELPPPAVDDRGGGIGEAATADGRWVALRYSSGDRPRAAGVWDAVTGEKRCDLPIASADLRAVRVTPDGRRAVTLSLATDGRVEGVVADLRTGAEVVRLVPLPAGGLGTVAVSPAGTRLAVATPHAGAVWDLGTGADARPGGGHRGEVTAVSFSGDGKTVVSAGADGMVRGWSAGSGAERWAVGAPDAGLAGPTPDGTGVLLTAVGPGLPKVLRVADGRPVVLPAALADPAEELLAFSPDGRLVVGVRKVDPRHADLRAFDWPAGTPARSIPLAGPGWKSFRYGTSQVRFSPDGREVAAASLFDRKPGTVGGSHNSHRVERYDLSAGRLLSAVDVTANRPLLLSAFGRLAFLAVDAPDPAGPELRDAATGAPVGRLKLPRMRSPGSGVLQLAATSPDGRRLLVVADDRVEVFDPADGRHRGTWAGVRPTALGFSPDGQRLAVGDAAGTCTVWEVSGRVP